MAQSGLNARQFSRFWRVESEDAGYGIAFQGDTCEVTAPKGLTLWRRQKLTAPCSVEYDVQIVVEDSAADRLSDMNCFWLAGDPQCRDIWQRMSWRNGNFLRCYSLRMYYVGYGGNYNTTTRFRRYTGDERGVDSAAFRPPVITEYTDSSHLLKPNHWYHIKVQSAGGRTQMWVDGECIVSYLDPEPIEEGWFGFRSTLSHFRITNYRYSSVLQSSLSTGIPLQWVAMSDSVANTNFCDGTEVPVTFGIPFSQGEIHDLPPLQLSNGTQCDAWVNARWADGTVKWAALSTVAPVFRQLEVVRSDNRRRSGTIHIIETDNRTLEGQGYVVHIGRTGGSNLIDSIVVDGRKVAGALSLIASAGQSAFTGRIDSIKVERQGSQLSVVRFSGMHCGEGRAWLPFIVRLYVFHGSRQMKLVHTFIYDGNEETDFISSLGVRLGIPLREPVYNRHIAFATEDGGVWHEAVQPLDGRRTLESCRNATQLQAGCQPVSLPTSLSQRDSMLIHDFAAWDGYRLSQPNDNGFSIQKRAVSPQNANNNRPSPWIGTFTGRRASGSVFAGDVTGGVVMSMADFWQSYPSTIQVDHARSSEASLTMYMWSPEAEPMNLCHYDTIAHGLEASYEDVQPGLSSPYGIGRTTTLWIVPQSGAPTNGELSRLSAILSSEPRLMPTPQYLHEKRAFGVWSLCDSLEHGAVENRLTQYLDFYRDAIEQHKWYGFWNYGDIMHAYSPDRHSWRYDVGGFAWDNTELATPMWLWYSFLRTGRADVWRMAEAMTRHNSEVDTYHIGPLAPLGSRHNVSHWGCGAKEARISQAAFLRFYYYLTGDDRTGDLMHAQADCDTLLYHLDPMRLAEPRSQYPCTAPARLRFGPDWLAYAGNWMTEWERTGNTFYRDKIMAGLRSVAEMPDGLFTGNKAWGYDPATGQMSYEGPSGLQHTNHLATIMGGFEVMTELLDMIGSQPPASQFKPVWLDYALRYKSMALGIGRNHFPVRRLQAYGAWQTRSPQLAAEAWHDLWHRIEHAEAPQFSIDRVLPPLVPAPVDEWHGLSTNDAALWSLDALYMLETIGAFNTTEQ